MRTDFSTVLSRYGLFTTLAVPTARKQAAHGCETTRRVADNTLGNQSNKWFCTEDLLYANSQILMQHNGAPATNNKYFYLHDRLGSVRQVINQNGSVEKYYTYEPFGKILEEGGTLGNPFMFTGQYYDSEIAEYYLRARQYDPHIARFTSRDPVTGGFKEPLSLHKYLYCENDLVNHIDPNGRTALDLERIS